MATEYEKQGLTNSEYVMIHAWLRENKIKTGACEHCGYETRLEYALINGLKYEKIATNYILLCAACHRRCDRMYAKGMEDLLLKSYLKKQTAA